MNENAVFGYIWRCDRSDSLPRLVREPSHFPLPGRGSILIRIKAAGINRADLYQLDGHYPPPDGYADVPGLEISGIVEHSGHDTVFNKGDAVCALLPAGGYASHACVPAAHAASVPDNISFARAAAMPECYVTALHNIHDVAGLKKGERLFLHAASGGLGPACIHTARLAGIVPYAVTRDAANIPFLLAQGAERCYIYGDDYKTAFLNDTNGAGAHAVFDTVGADTFSDSLKIAANDGVVVVLGFLSGAYLQTSLTRILTKRLRVIGSTVRYLSHDTKAALMHRFASDILSVGRHYPAYPAIDRVFSADEPEAALRYMRACAHSGKIVLQA